MFHFFKISSWFLLGALRGSVSLSDVFGFLFSVWLESVNGSQRSFVFLSESLKHVEKRGFTSQETLWSGVWSCWISFKDKCSLKASCVKLHSCPNEMKLYVHSHSHRFTSLVSTTMEALVQQKHALNHRKK